MTAEIPQINIGRRHGEPRKVRFPVGLVTTLYGVNLLMQNSSSDGTQWLPMFA